MKVFVQSSNRATQEEYTSVMEPTIKGWIKGWIKGCVKEGIKEYTENTEEKFNTNLMS